MPRRFSGRTVHVLYPMSDLRAHMRHRLSPRWPFPHCVASCRHCTHRDFHVHMHDLLSLFGCDNLSHILAVLPPPVICLSNLVAPYEHRGV
ncbi:hypothetical protein EXIGLDRAFT_230713 [Exidia glandulosa HHB12029]|uniref:Uncharacterized protein n=1 Tax=Exidia glandulosa HHB12029 TaxID=1314781 RepID=A0A165E5R7_EXIGL|nr:hypothetical protein EXIGLDRAFT_343950 [Exidia glandulosa HHB12029]KZV86130.1 hypothetical protein EXIGLDRAFT_230713 [Exidia glandulosa HHB12029]